jgi:hypothetical protein
LAMRTARRAMVGTVGGRPGLRRLLVSYLLAASLRCQASRVAGVTGKMPAQCLRGISCASTANHTRSAGSYRIRPACRRSTVFSCRSTSSSASFQVLAEGHDGEAEYPANQQVDDLEQHPASQPSPRPGCRESAAQAGNRVFEYSSGTRCSPGRDGSAATALALPLSPRGRSGLQARAVRGTRGCSHAVRIAVHSNCSSRGQTW